MCRSWGWWCWHGMRWTETGFKLASLINFVIFLHSGKYRWFPLTSVLVYTIFAFEQPSSPLFCVALSKALLEHRSCMGWSACVPCLSGSHECEREEQSWQLDLTTLLATTGAC